MRAALDGMLSLGASDGTYAFDGNGEYTAKINVKDENLGNGSFTVTFTFLENGTATEKVVATVEGEAEETVPFCGSS